MKKFIPVYSSFMYTEPFIIYRVDALDSENTIRKNMTSWNKLTVL